MALTTQTAPIGSNFDGTSGLGEVVLSTNLTDDTQRAELLSVAVQSIADTKTSIRILLAPSLAAIAAGSYLELANLEDATGLTQACCRCIVPRGWNLYALTLGPTTTATVLNVDWHRVTLEPRA